MKYSQHKFRVFVDNSGNFGDPVSLVIDDGKKIDFNQRLAITTEIGNVETVFVNDLETNDVSIYHAYGEVDFAGTVLIGAAWELEQLKNMPTRHIKCQRGLVDVRREGDIYWIRASLENNIGDWEYEQLAGQEDVDAISVADTKGWKKMVWAWIDENEGLIRARTFADAIGMPEVQGNGSGSMSLSGRLQRQLAIRHGDGSVMYARSLGHNVAEVGGRVVRA